ncbi:hypothetical protein BRC81_15100 [Halobacteriales archaeon QS_1_68_20]|nr:MAG: hypothetical protein BRC81_15100 [Halobacteriales archaeon QS_1_68_20]
MTDAEYDEETVTRTWTSDVSLVRSRLRTVGVGVGTGLVAGMGAFMYVRDELVPTHGIPLLPGPEWYPVVMMALAGIYVYLLTPDSRESIVAGLVGFLVAVSTLVAAVVVPLYVLYPGPARGPLARQYLREAFPGLLNGLVLVYFGGYLTALLVLGYLDV